MDHRHYVPILKWKLGEYQALMRLSPAAKDALTPLIEIPPISYDHETQQNAKSIDEHLLSFGKRLKDKWQSRPCFIDLTLLNGEGPMAGGGHPLTYIFDQARANGCGAIPVVRLSSNTAYRAAVAGAVAVDRRGLCLRLTASDFDRANLAGDVADLLTALRVGAPDVDLVLDMESAPHRQVVPVFSVTMVTFINQIPLLARWRSFVIAGTAYPESVSHIRPPFELVPRTEWAVYKAVTAMLPATVRLPTFGDYTVSYPVLPGIDMRMVDPIAKLRYTTESHWYVGRGAQVKANGFEQYRGMCATLVAQPFFMGAGFSDGDRIIDECAAGTGSTGNLTVWSSVATNHHLTQVVGDLANFHAISAAA
ncbi:hypothetical protein FW320_12560 [Azospirillum sp. Vi22]|uniref:beta family protein n=1 Tax=Azospirillum baldaniorum TaxID=1064539 RepID=UPI00157AD5F8|nr:beta family protein [Azospirillum baldaniorum]NUB07005.1 hypothetical protein [Azospirillum baldaniorum]